MEEIFKNVYIQQDLVSKSGQEHAGAGRLISAVWQAQCEHFPCMGAYLSSKATEVNRCIYNSDMSVVWKHAGHLFMSGSVSCEPASVMGHS